MDQVKFVEKTAFKKIEVIWSAWYGLLRLSSTNFTSSILEHLTHMDNKILGIFK